MLTTVIIPTWNRAHLLPISIGSLLRQSHDATLDILVVDDGSTDETPAVVEYLADRHPCIRYIRQPHKGVAAARNTGLSRLLPETEIVTFLDSDDASPPGRFAADLGLFRADVALDVTYGRMRQVTAIDPVTLEPPPDAIIQDLCAPQLSLALFRRRAIERTGQFDQELRQSEDTDFLFRVFEGGARFVQNDSRALYYLSHPQNMTANCGEVAHNMRLAMAKLIRRRKADPMRSTNRPKFDSQSATPPEQRA